MFSKNIRLGRAGKKYLVLISLFVLPIVIYMFFASGVNNFYRLPVLTTNVSDLENFNSLAGDSLSLEGKITVLGFLGTDVLNKKGNLFNLNQKIYKRFYQFRDFQFVMILPKGTEADVEAIKNELAGATATDTKKWRFAFASPFAVKEQFNSLQTNFLLDKDLASPYVFIIDKQHQLRGRKKDDDNTKLYGYDSRSVAVINNKMEDDIKIVLAEYRLALKKNNNYQNRRQSLIKQKSE